MTAGRCGSYRCPVSIHIVSIGERLCADTRGEREVRFHDSGSVGEVTIRSVAGDARFDQPSKKNRVDLGPSGKVRWSSAQDTQLGDCPSNKEDQQDGEHRYPEPSQCTEDALSGRSATSATSGPVGGGGVYLAPIEWIGRCQAQGCQHDEECEHEMGDWAGQGHSGLGVPRPRRVAGAWFPPRSSTPSSSDSGCSQGRASPCASARARGR